jgi:adenylate cyclase
MTPEARVERKLAAILHADVQGYSRLLGEDEVSTLRTVASHLALMRSLVEQHGGRAVGSRGDSLLAEFPSVVEAVQCAVEMQQALKDRNAPVPAGRRVEFRIGINLGEVVVEGEEIYGEGVNIAVRLEGVAEAGGICLSEVVHQQLKNKLALAYEDLGTQTLKNIAEPMRVYRVAEPGSAPLRARTTDKKPPAYKRKAVLVAVLVLVVGIASSVLLYRFRPPSSPVGVSADKVAALPLPEKPSLVVLPFVNLSGDPAQEYFSDGLTEDLTTALAKVSALFVIARHSAFVYKGKPVDIKAVSRTLGVRYVLEGSVQRADNRVRISAQLVDGLTAAHVWAESYDRDLKDIFALQDEVRQEIVLALKVTLTPDEQARLRHDPTGNLQAYDSLLRGWAQLYRLTPDSFAQARQLFAHAIELDPTYAAAYAALGYAYWGEYGAGYNPDPQLLTQAMTFARKAISLDTALPRAHIVLGVVSLFQKQHDQAVAELEQAIALDPNFADAYAELAHILTYAGRPQDAVRRIEQAMRLNPTPPDLYYVWILGRAYALLGRYDEALPLLQKVVTRYPEHFPAHADLAAIYSEVGREGEAQAEVAELRRLNPQLSLEWLREMAPLKIRRS